MALTTNSSKIPSLPLGAWLVLTLFSTPAMANSLGDQWHEGSRAIASSHCPAYAESNYSVARETLEADPSNWIEQIVNAPAGAEVLLADGLYQLDRYAVVLKRPLTLRSASGDRDAVVIEGQGYGVESEALMIMADDVHIADLTIRNVRDHAISIKPGFARSVIYNVELIDVGTQHIKGNRMGPDGLIACSGIGYSTDIAPGDYNGAIDLHGAVGWTIRDNRIFNIWGDGSGCLVDEQCGNYYPGGGPAILLWKGSGDNTVERNRITGSFRGISLGLGAQYSGGVVRDNFVYLDVPGKEGVDGFVSGDAGISLLGADNVVVEGNTVLLAGGYPGAIELQDVHGVLVRNNLVSAPIWNRGNSQYNDCVTRTNDDCDSAVYANIVIPSAGGEWSQRGSATQILTSPQLTQNSAASDDKVSQVAELHNPPPDNRLESRDLAPSLGSLISELNEVVARVREERYRGTEVLLRMKDERLRLLEMMLFNQRERWPDQPDDLLPSDESFRLHDELALRQRLRHIDALLLQLAQ